MKRASDPVIDLAERRRQRDEITTLADLSGSPIWLGWRSENGTKVPYCGGGGRGDATAPETWRTRDECERWAAKQRQYGKVAGIGAVLGVEIADGSILIGCDLDACQAPDGLISDWAAEIIARFASYAETSPSGAGVKVFARWPRRDLALFQATLGGSGRKWAWKTGEAHPPAIEIYGPGRFFCVTGQRLDDVPEELRVIDPPTLQWLVNTAVPSFVASDPAANKAKADGKTGRDNSRSGAAYRLAQTLHQAGKTYTDFIAALRADPELAAWYAEKGRRNGEREAKRAWERAQIADPAITELNETYALVLSGGRTAILKEDGDEWSLIAVDAFKQWHANRFAPGAGVNTKPMPLANFWLTHAQRRQYDGIVFAPQRETPGRYNLWRGFAVEPRPGECGRFLAHVLENVCRGDDERYRWVIGWFADLFQHPGEKCGTALALRGRQGVGKTIVGKIIGSLLGQHYVAVSDPRYVTGRFNSHLVSALLLHADEGFWAGDHAAEGKIKDLVTGDFHFIEFKGKEPIKIRNYVRLLVTGNPDWLVPAGMEERRFAVFDVGENHMQDHAYFSAIEQQMDEGGREALLDYLLGFDLAGVHLRQIPKTAALLDQKIASLPPEKGWLLDLLRNGRLPWGCPEDNACPCDALFDNYVLHANRQGARRRGIETAIGRFLKKMLPTLRRDRATGSLDDDRAYVYHFPPLAECRRLFDQLIQGSIDWGPRGKGFFDIDEWEKEPPRDR